MGFVSVFILVFSFLKSFLVLHVHSSLCHSPSGAVLGCAVIRVSDSKVAITKPVPFVPDGTAGAGAGGQQARTIYVANLDRALTEADLRSFFGQCGAIANVYIVPGPPHRHM